MASLKNNNKIQLILFTAGHLTQSLKLKIARLQQFNYDFTTYSLLSTDSESCPSSNLSCFVQKSITSARYFVAFEAAAEVSLHFYVFSRAFLDYLKTTRTRTLALASHLFSLAPCETPEALQPDAHLSPYSLMFT